MLVPLRNSDKFAIIDDHEGWKEDILSQKWYLNARGYVVTAYTEVKRFAPPYKIKLHELIIGEKPGFYIDHINGDKLDNRESNLRHVDKFQHNWNRRVHKRNRHGNRGIVFSEGKWWARIMANGKRLSLGYFSAMEDAVAARKKAEQELYGEYARKEW